MRQPAAPGPAPAKSAELICAAGASSPFQTASVAVEIEGSDVIARWTWKGTPPRTGTFGLFLTLDGPFDGDLHQLGYKSQDGQQIGFFDFDMGTAQQANLQGGPGRLGATGVDLRFTGSAAPYSAGFTAKGAVSVDGNDVMTCAP